jgi:hypothetical protein
MDIPNSVIHIKCADGRGYGPLLLPAYFERILRRVFMQRLDPDAPGKGVLVEPYPANGDPDTRYRVVYSVAEERGLIRQAYKADKNGFVDDVYTDAELGEAMEKELMAEANRLALLNRPKEVIVPHASYKAFGLTDEQAISLQQAGFAERSVCVGVSLMKLNNAGVPLDVAQKLAVADAAVAKAK